MDDGDSGEGGEPALSSVHYYELARWRRNKTESHLSESMFPQISNRYVEEITQGTLLNPEGSLILAQIKNIMMSYLSTLPPLKQEEYWNKWLFFKVLNS